MTKPGYKTTEFWIQLIPTVMAIVTIANPKLANAIAAIAAALSTSGYAISRSVTKSKQTTNDPSTGGVKYNTLLAAPSPIVPTPTTGTPNG